MSDGEKLTMIIMVMIMEGVECGGGVCGGVTTAADGLPVGNN